jgi:hypothetical protein
MKGKPEPEATQVWTAVLGYVNQEIVARRQPEYIFIGSAVADRNLTSKAPRPAKTRTKLRTKTKMGWTDLVQPIDFIGCGGRI